MPTVHSKTNTMKRWLYLSLFLNFFLICAGFWAVYRLGGWRYALLRLQRDTAGLYFHRKSHFEQQPDRPGSIVFLGDSHVEQAEWHELFGDDPPVLNRGISGDYTAAVLDRLPEVLRHKPRKIFLWVGVNDLIFGKTAADVEPYYRQLVQKIRSDSPDTELFLLNLMPVNNNTRRSGTNNEAITAMNRSIEQIAHDFTLPYIDLNALMRDGDGNLATKFSEDGMHLNGHGYQAVRTALKGFVEQ